MNKTLLIKFSFFLLITVSCSKETIEKPNIVLIVADDLGWSDLSYMGSTYYETPNIDKLSKSGMTFYNGYASAANCAASRATLLSGKYKDAQELESAYIELQKKLGTTLVLVTHAPDIAAKCSRIIRLADGQIAADAAAKVALA